MTEQRTTPAPVRGLRLLRGGTPAGGTAAPGTGTGGGTDPGTVPPPVPGGEVVPMTAPERAAAAVRHWGGNALRAASELWLHPGRLLHVIAHGKAETMREHRAHIKSRAWVPDGMTGTPEKAVIAAGLFHHLLIARPLKAAMKAVKFTAEKVDQAADRPLRLLKVTVFITVLVLILLHL